MPRPRGPHSRDASVPLCVRVPKALADRIFAAAGAEKGSELAEYLRNALRKVTGTKLDFAAGYEEGKAKGWAEANQRFREAMKGS